MNRNTHRCRTVLIFVLAFHFTFIAPTQATVVLPKTLHIKVERPMKFIANWGVKEIGRFETEIRGWHDKQFLCLNKLWTIESHWNYRARNPSGAYGIPQALPGNKMDMAGADWRTSPTTQIRWGLRYIKIRYGSPCQALRHEYFKGYY